MYTWKNKDSEVIFKVENTGFSLNGVYGGKEQSELEFAIEVDAGYDTPAVMPQGWWAQVGYMTTNPQKEGLGYMMIYALAKEAQEVGITTIYVSSGSVKGGGKYLIEALGGKFDNNLEFELKPKKKKDKDKEHKEEEPGKAKLPGYVLKVETMMNVAQEGYKKKGWQLG